MNNQLGSAWDVPQIPPLTRSLIDRPIEAYEPQRARHLAVNIVYLRQPVGQVNSGFDYALSIGQGRLGPDSQTQLSGVQEHYAVLDSRQLSRILDEVPAIYELLREAVAPLKDAFGDESVFQVRVQSADDDMLVKVAVQLPSRAHVKAENDLKSFDCHWWLDNCHRSRGMLVFDYEIRDAV